MQPVLAQFTCADNRTSTTESGLRFSYYRSPSSHRSSASLPCSPGGTTKVARLDYLFAIFSRLIMADPVVSLPPLSHCCAEAGAVETIRSSGSVPFSNPLPRRGRPWTAPGRHLAPLAGPLPALARPRPPSNLRTLRGHAGFLGRRRAPHRPRARGGWRAPEAGCSDRRSCRQSDRTAMSTRQHDVQ